MSKQVNEDQTQVYGSGYVQPQYGIPASAPYLNNPPKQLLDFVSVLYTQSHKTGLNAKAGKVISEGGMSDNQILSVLVGMGTPQQLALRAIEMVKHNSEAPGPEVYNVYNENLNKQKNNNKMNFTLVSLYENVVKCINSLDEMAKDKSRVSYSATNAKTILKQSLSQFPMRFKNDDVKVVSEEIENSVNPTLKFKIAKNLYNGLSSVDWLNPVREIKSYISEAYNEMKWSFRISEAIERVSTQRGTLYENLTNDLTELIGESDELIKAKMPLISNKNIWSGDCKAIISEMAAEDKQLTSNSRGKISKVFSPVLETVDGYKFHLNGKNYVLNEGKIEETTVSDSRFFDVLEGLGMFSNINDTLITYGENGKTLEYNINEGTLTIGKSDLTNASIIELKEALIGVNFFGYRNQWKVDKVCKFFESIDLLHEMDNFTNISSTDFLNLFLTVISVDEGVWINKVNGGMQLNEMKFYPTATEATEVIKEFIDYDASNLFANELVREGNERAKVEKIREDLNNRISFLEEKKSDVEAAIKKIGESDELKSALKLVQEELVKYEKELADTYSVSEKKTKDEYLDDGYVEAIIVNPVAGFKKGEKVLVNAEEYSSLGNDEMLNAIVPSSDKKKIIKKGDVKTYL